MYYTCKSILKKDMSNRIDFQCYALFAVKISSLMLRFIHTPIYGRVLVKIHFCRDFSCLEN